MQQLRFVFVPVLLIVVALSCAKKTSDSVAPGDPLSGMRTQASDACTAFRYADTLFYLREQSSDYVVSPVTAQSGTYGAYPAGLVINATNGRINVTQSETGLKYRVWFVKLGSADTCSRYVTISGINYVSRVYRLNQNDTLVQPFYNAVRTLATPCKDAKNKDEDDKADKCEYDDDRDDDDGDGLGDEPPSGYQVTAQGIDINKLLGSINLKKTVANGAFGATPVNGTVKNIRIYYRLYDASKKALNFIDVRLHFYKKVSDVPNSLLNQIIRKQGATLRRPASAASAGPMNLEDSRPRPPDIVVCLQ